MKQLTKIEQIIGKTITRVVENGEQNCLFFGEEYIVFELESDHDYTAIQVGQDIHMSDKLWLGIITKEEYSVHNEARILNERTEREKRDRAKLKQLKVKYEK